MKKTPLLHSRKEESNAILDIPGIPLEAPDVAGGVWSVEDVGPKSYLICGKT